MKDDSKLVELGAHDPTVQSVISRLNRNIDDIEHITVLISWKSDNSVTMGQSTMTLPEMAMHKCCHDAGVAKRFA